MLRVLSEQLDTLVFEFWVLALHQFLEKIVPDEPVISLPFLPLQFVVLLKPCDACFSQVLRKLDILRLLDTNLEAFIHLSNAHFQDG